MSNFAHPNYDQLRDIIKTMGREAGWDKAKYALGENFNDLSSFIENQKKYYILPSYATPEIWLEIAEWAQKTEEEEKTLHIKDEQSTLIDNGSDNEVHVPTNPRSSWQLYKKKLLNDKWTENSILEIEKTTLKVLKKLTLNSQEVGSVKGLMVGHVQSGKTANMAALIAMAADWGWNFFVVLSGVIDNLRKQTSERLISDLNHKGNLSWHPLEKPAPNSPAGHRASDLVWESGANQRYLTVVLKNQSRLRKLIDWMNKDKNKLRQMKILVIDDEADQAGINSKDIEKEERAKINSLILELVNGKKDSQNKPGAMNYICYTATPYANVLNEYGEDTLYPKDFIGVLKTSNEYFGPKEIFGLFETDDAGLDITRNISDEDLQRIEDIHLGNTRKLPESFADAICWFMCTVAVRRFWGQKKPVSMLVHTSQKQTHHKFVAESIEQWINEKSSKEMIELCKEVYEMEKKRFDKKKFREGYISYNTPDEEILEYPDFNAIKNEISILINEITHIPLSDTGELKYHQGIHLCIDNCANNGITDENMYVRLAYPKAKGENTPKIATAFIVVGGSTLSRGLTIEGLTSTYFLRTSKQGDTLMQMGRWFGYRKGYELLPRIWMTDDTFEKFQFLASVEQELREDLKEFSEFGLRPEEYGPKVKNSPELSWMNITAKNRMQSAIETELDFSGISAQTTIFKNDKEILSHNIKTTERFLKGLPNPIFTPERSGLLWKNVDFENLKEDFLFHFKFNPNSRIFNQIHAFADWYKQVEKEEGFSGWNVILSGTGKVPENNMGWDINGHKVGLVERTRKGKRSLTNNSISIGVLRAPKDLYADVDPNELRKANIPPDTLTASNARVREVREKVGLDKTPQLIIYRINKDSEVKNEKGKRSDLNFGEDIIGLSLLVPGKKNKNLAKKLTINLKEDSLADLNDGDLGGDSSEN
ncbi:hypothetical protein L1279_001130 [Planomicrobium sp. HSC-17F08]|nr:hypothetical protein [Planomicrobium sp. HSC-17F08]